MRRPPTPPPFLFSHCSSLPSRMYFDLLGPWRPSYQHGSGNLHRKGEVLHPGQYYTVAVWRATGRKPGINPYPRNGESIPTDPNGGEWTLQRLRVTDPSRVFLMDLVIFRSQNPDSPRCQLSYKGPGLRSKPHPSSTYHIQRRQPAPTPQAGILCYWHLHSEVPCRQYVSGDRSRG